MVELGDLAAGPSGRAAAVAAAAATGIGLRLSVPWGDLAAFGGTFVCTRPCMYTGGCVYMEAWDCVLRE